MFAAISCAWSIRTKLAAPAFAFADFTLPLMNLDLTNTAICNPGQPSSLPLNLSTTYQKLSAWTNSGNMATSSRKTYPSSGGGPL
ncbi:hypothetical protein F5X68DRAFT_203374 [Plectosphaerella plurivora]|uniref:Uncharacterized protein n=1 Tax=Plectosphaerella plurivora TaxID=936078 RepID=A0A9P8VGA9_9PEZI|nr:hypothetical protein F5X68DRAFT_203374 [Plectosphaerella plurivora]